ncbi:MAG: hypothetical protein CMK59_06885 [Proteobacteria bacterium]|nr:hypothetical protein [Pseudomonadota bacterium]
MFILSFLLACAEEEIKDIADDTADSSAEPSGEPSGEPAGEPSGEPAGEPSGDIGDAAEEGSSDIQNNNTSDPPPEGSCGQNNLSGFLFEDEALQFPVFVWDANPDTGEVYLFGLRAPEDTDACALVGDESFFAYQIVGLYTRPDYDQLPTAITIGLESSITAHGFFTYYVSDESNPGEPIQYSAGGGAITINSMLYGEKALFSEFNVGAFQDTSGTVVEGSSLSGTDVVACFCDGLYEFAGHSE